MSPDPGSLSSVRNDTATTVCGQCATSYVPVGRQQWCSPACRQAAWRRQRVLPRTVLAPVGDIVYQCPDCETRYLNERRCADCNTWCRNIGPGGNCPHCDEPVATRDLGTSS